MPRRPSKGWKNFFNTRWYLLAGGIIFCLILISSIRAFWQSYQVNSEIKQLQAQAAQLEAEQFSESSTLAYVESPAYVEDQARTQLNLMKQGEHVTVISGTGQKSTVGQKLANVIESKPPSNPELWWNYFFGVKNN